MSAIQILWLYIFLTRVKSCRAHLTLNDELPNRIACGTVRVKPGIKSFTETGVQFDDGSFVEGVDEVILATGFSYHFDMIEGGKLIEVDENKSDIYKYVFPLATADHNTLAVIGLIQPLGSIMPISEMQARVYMESFANGMKLPSKDQVGVTRLWTSKPPNRSLRKNAGNRR